MSNPWRDKETLQELYVEKRLTSSEIADRLGCSSRTVTTWLNKNGIETRKPDANPNAEWRDKDLLRELYSEKKLSMEKIAERLDCSQAVISKWLRKHDIERRVDGENTRSELPWYDKERLETLYCEKGLSSREVGERLGTNGSTILNALDWFDIDTRERHKAHQLSMWAGPASHGFGTDGYEYASTTIDNKPHRFYIHRLVAVSKYGFDAVCDKVVHHKNGVRWDNRPENIELKSHSDHAKHHAEETDGYIGQNLDMVE